MSSRSRKSRLPGLPGEPLSGYAPPSEAEEHPEAEDELHQDVRRDRYREPLIAAEGSTAALVFHQSGKRPPIEAEPETLGDERPDAASQP